MVAQRRSPRSRMWYGPGARWTAHAQGCLRKVADWRSVGRGYCLCADVPALASTNQATHCTFPLQTGPWSAGQDLNLDLPGHNQTG